MSIDIYSTGTFSNEEKEAILAKEQYEKDIAKKKRERELSIRCNGCIHRSPYMCDQCINS